MESKNNHFISLFELTLLCIVMVSVSGVALLMFNWFSSIRSLIAGSILALLTIIVLKAKVSSKLRGSVDPVLLIILLVALFFRAEPYLWVMGGQDQGTYVNMSAQYERTGSTFIKDRIREQVNAEDRPSYDQTQVLYKRITQDAKELQGKYPIKFSQEKNRYYFAMSQPAVYLKNLSNSEYVFQFYPLHPIWLAIAGKLLGSDNRVFSVVMFSLLSIVALYSLAKEISGDRIPALLLATFLALNPLHAFFAKFPVSETVGLFFSTTGILFLLRYYKGLQENQPTTLNFILSVGSFFCLFVTHITGFLYISLLSAVLVVLLLIENKKIKIGLYRYYVALVALFMVSLFYGYFYSFPYFYEVFSTMLRPVLGHYWASIMVLLLLGFQGILILLLRTDKRLNINETTIQRVLLALILLIVAVACYRIYQIGYTSKYVGHGYYDKEYHLVGSALMAIVKSNLFVYMKYLTPIAFLAMLCPLFSGRVLKHKGVYLVFAFVAFFAAFRLVASLITPYQYYYARYLFAEIIPFSLLLASLCLGTWLQKTVKWKQFMATVAILLISGYFVWITSLQLQGREGDGAASTLNRISGYLDDNQLLIYKFEAGKGYQVAESQFIIPLMSYYNKNMIFISSVDDLKLPMIASLIKRYNTAFILSKEPVQSPATEYVDTIGYKHGIFIGTSGIPSQFTYEKFNLYLYRIIGT